MSKENHNSTKINPETDIILSHRATASKQIQMLKYSNPVALISKLSPSSAKVMGPNPKKPTPAPKKFLDEIDDFDQCVYKDTNLNPREDNSEDPFEDMMDDFYNQNFKKPFLKKKAEKTSNVKKMKKKPNPKQIPKNEISSKNTLTEKRKSTTQTRIIHKSLKIPQGKDGKKISKTVNLRSALFKSKKDFFKTSSILKKSNPLGKKIQFAQNFESCKRVSFNKKVVVFKFRTNTKELKVNGNAEFLKNLKKHRTSLR